MKLLLASLISWLAFTPAIAVTQEEMPEFPFVGEEIKELIRVFTGFINYFLDWIPGLGGAIVVLMIIWGGIQYITGDKEKGKKTLIAAVIGAIIVIMAYVIIMSIGPMVSPPTE